MKTLVFILIIASIPGFAMENRLSKTQDQACRSLLVKTPARKRKIRPGIIARYRNRLFLITAVSDESGDSFGTRYYEPTPFASGYEIRDDETLSKQHLKFTNYYLKRNHPYLHELEAIGTARYKLEFEDYEAAEPTGTRNLRIGYVVNQSGAQYLITKLNTAATPEGQLITVESQLLKLPNYVSQKRREFQIRLPLVGTPSEPLIVIGKLTVKPSLISLSP